VFFSETLEYATFAWREAVVNAVAHRHHVCSYTTSVYASAEDGFTRGSHGRPITCETPS